MKKKIKKLWETEFDEIYYILCSIIVMRICEFVYAMYYAQ